MQTTLESRIAEILDKAQADVKKAELESAICSALPVLPDHVLIHSLYGASALVTYNATSNAHALVLCNALASIAVPSYVHRSGNTVSTKAIDDEKSEQVTEALATVRISKYETSINFYVSLPDIGVVRVSIALGGNPFGHYVVRDKHRTKFYYWDFIPSSALNCLHRVACYAPGERFGPSSARESMYAVYEAFELDNLLGGN